MEPTHPPPTPAQSHYQTGMTLARQGRLAEAAAALQQTVSLQPDHVDALHNLGTVLFMLGNVAAAIDRYQQVLRFKRDHGGVLYNLGIAFQRLGKTEQALASYSQAVTLEPHHFDARINLGNLLKELGRLDEAVVCYDQVLQLKPDFAEVHANLGNTFAAKGQWEAASACYQRAIHFKPLFPGAHYGLGVALAELGQLEEAAASLQQALLLNPGSAEAYLNLGAIRNRQGQSEEAVLCFQRAVQITPESAQAYFGWGSALQVLTRIDEAIPCYRQTLNLDPHNRDAHYNLGLAFQRQDKFDEASQCFREAIRLKRDAAEAHNGLGEVLLAQGLPHLALASLQEALRLKPGAIAAQSNYLFCLNCDPEADPDQVFAEHRRWGQLHESTSLSAGKNEPRPIQANPRDRERRLRIGYVSPDLRRHAVARYFEPVLAHHDHQQFEVFCYAQVSNPDAVTARLQSLAQGWRSTCDLSDSELANVIRRDRIDILVDLAGHTVGNRLPVFEEKPAPIQATWLGYLNTTGLTAVDYRLTDAWLDPPGQPVRDSEELVRLPAGMCCFAPPDDAPAVTPLPALRKGHITFGSLNNPLKINGSVLDLWSRVLLAVPPSRLLMFHDKLTLSLQERVRHYLTERGVPGDRLDLRQGSSSPGYLGIYAQIDVTLDPFPNSGGVTTCESLWMGVPVLTLCGVRPAGRNSASLLTRLGLHGWVAQSLDQYIDLAQQLTSDLDHLADMRTTLRDQMATTICDAARFTKTLEDAYRTMWRRQPVRTLPH